MDILKEFQDYKGMISAYCKDQLTTPSSEYGGLKDYVESFTIQLKNTIDTVWKQELVHYGEGPHKPDRVPQARWARITVLLSVGGEDDMGP